MAQSDPVSYLTERQDANPPKRTTVDIPGLGKLHGFIWPDGLRQFHSIPYGRFTKNWTRSTMVESWPGDQHDGTKIG